MLRWLTAGESHGPALVAVLEGLPAGVAVTTADIGATLARRRLGLRPRRPDEVRAGRGRAPRRRAARPHAGRPGRRSRSATPSGPSGSTVMSRRPGDAEPCSRPGAQRAADPAAPRPRRPGRHAEVRLRRRPAGARAGQRARDRGAGRARRGRRGVPRAGRRRRGWSATSSRSAPVAVAGRRRCRPRTTSPRWTPTRCAASTRRPSAAMVAEIDAGQTRRRHARRRRRGARLRPAAGPGQPRALGPPPRRPAGRRADGHPGDQGRRGRRRLRDRAPPRLAGPRRDRAGRRRCIRRSRPGRRHRGRHDHRRAAAGPRRDEADLHRAARAATVDVATGEAGRGDQPALRRVRGAGRRVVAEAMVALVLADAVLEKFGGD